VEKRIVPASVILRIVLFANSATKRFPALSNATPLGSLKRALLFVPFALPRLPANPATVVTTQFAPTSVESVEGFSGGEAFDSAREVAEALKAFHQAGAAAGPEDDLGGVLGVQDQKQTGQFLRVRKLRKILGNGGI